MQPEKQLEHINAPLVEPILMDDALSSDNKETVVAYSVTFPHIYNGYTVDDDKLVAIVDNDGVKYTAVNWSEIQKKEIK